MIFTPANARQISRGQKTQTRRPIKPGETKCRYKPGHTYAVQPGRGKPSVCRIEILTVAEQRLGDLTYQDARAEGYKIRDDFWAAWADIHGGAADLAQPVWAITFRLHADVPRLLVPGTGGARYDPKDEGKPDTPGDHGYTTNPARAMRDEPEAVPADTQERMARDARAKERVTRSQAWAEARTVLVDQLERLKAAGPGRHAAREIRAIEARIRRLDDRYAA